MSNVKAPYPQFYDLNGDVLDGGYIYIGLPNQNPVTDPVTVYWDAALTQPAAQPIRTVNGYPSRNGTPANVFLSVAYSTLVRDSKGRLLFYQAENPEPIYALFMEAFLASATEAAARAILDVPSNAEAILKTIIDAKGDSLWGTAADTPARLAVGTEGSVVRVTAAAAAGVAWAKPTSTMALGKLMYCSIATASASTAQFTATEVVLKNATGGTYLAEAVSVNPDLAVAGLNGLDTGVEAISTWYYEYVIYNPTTGVIAGLWSANSVAPTLPAGFTFYGLVSAAYNDAAGNLVPSFQRGNEIFYRALRNLVTNGGAVAETPLAITTMAPPNALSAQIAIRYMGCTGSGAGQIDMTTYLRHTTGQNFLSPYLGVQAVGVSVPAYFPGPVCEVPYTGNLYFLSAVSTGSAPTVTIDCLGFKLPIGGE